ncbi:MAG TPA: carbohydrate kinase [Anaeromyxobacter sp.]|nr:carbohydrate kinase [Anaeromyxobacter sp.]
MSVGARFVVFGEALTDFLREGVDRWRSVPGGAPWNVARVAARLGVPTGYAGGVSTDVFGEELTQLSLAAGLDARFLQRVDRPTLLAMVVSKAPPHYFFVGERSADVSFDPERMPTGWLGQAEVVYFGSISLLRQPLGAQLLNLAEQVHAAGRRICFDPNYRKLASEGYRPAVERMLAIADYVKLSDEDLAGLFPGAAQPDGLRALRARAPRAQVLFTRGAEGMQLLADGQKIERPVYPVPVVDTVGAGDACIGAWMASLLLRPGGSLEEHVAWAAAAAAASCAHAGAYAPLREEVEAICAGRGGAAAFEKG